MSRPRKATGAKLARQIIFRLKAKDYDKLSAQATRLGLSVNQLARKLTCEKSCTLVITTHNRVDPLLIKRLDRLANNLNQMTKNSHIFGRISPNLEVLCGKIEALIDDAINDEVQS